MTTAIETHAISPVQLQRLAELGYLYAVLDSCDAPAVVDKAEELGEERAVSLYRGRADEHYWAIAPYLVRVDPSLLDWILGTLAGEPWGIFAVSTEGFEVLYRHFRSLLVVSNPEGEPWYFRFYDPRVLAVSVQNCLAGERARIYGPVEAYAVTLGASEICLMVGPGEENLAANSATAY